MEVTFQQALSKNVKCTESQMTTSMKKGGARIGESKCWNLVYTIFIQGVRNSINEMTFQQKPKAIGL